MHSDHICRNVVTFLGVLLIIIYQVPSDESYSTKSSTWDPISHLQHWQQELCYLNKALSY